MFNKDSEGKNNQPQRSGQLHYNSMTYVFRVKLLWQ